MQGSVFCQSLCDKLMATGVTIFGVYSVRLSVLPVYQLSLCYILMWCYGLWCLQCKAQCFASRTAVSVLRIDDNWCYGLWCLIPSADSVLASGVQFCNPETEVLAPPPHTPHLAMHFNAESPRLSQGLLEGGREGGGPNFRALKLMRGRYTVICQCSI